MNANIVKKSSLFPVLLMYLKEFTVERNRIHVSIVEKLSLVPMTIIVVKVSTLEKTLMIAVFVAVGHCARTSVKI